MAFKPPITMWSVSSRRLRRRRWFRCCAPREPRLERPGMLRQRCDNAGRRKGAGDFADLEALTDWVTKLGGGMVATLPLLAAFLDEPFEPGPYSPASRLFWNEFYLDVPGIPELRQCPTAQALLQKPEFLQDVRELRAAPLVDYHRQMTLKRRV